MDLLTKAIEIQPYVKQRHSIKLIKATRYSIVPIMYNGKFELFTPGNFKTKLYPGESVAINLQIAVVFPEGCHGYVYGDDKLFSKMGLGVDTDIYEDREIIVITVSNFSPHPFVINPGQYISKMVVVEAYKVCHMNVEKLY